MWAELSELVVIRKGSNITVFKDSQMAGDERSGMSNNIVFEGTDAINKAEEYISTYEVSTYDKFCIVKSENFKMTGMYCNRGLIFEVLTRHVPLMFQLCVFQSILAAGCMLFWLVPLKTSSD